MISHASYKDRPAIALTDGDMQALFCPRTAESWSLCVRVDASF